MRIMKLNRVFTLLEPGPVVLVTTHDGKRSNVMTISWTMVVDFTPRFAISTGAWNYSYKALKKTRECVIAIPTVDMLDTVVGIGTCSGADTDKFAKFNLTVLPGKRVKAPLILRLRPGSPHSLAQQPVEDGVQLGAAVAESECGVEVGEFVECEYLGQVPRAHEELIGLAQRERL